VASISVIKIPGVTLKKLDIFLVLFYSVIN